jgi:hypothetical protein
MCSSSQFGFRRALKRAEIFGGFTGHSIATASSLIPAERLLLRIEENEKA